jgi:uncharacterized protein
MRIDCHVHISAVQPAHGKMSPKLLNSAPFRFLRWKFGLSPDESLDGRLETLLRQTIDAAPELDAAVVLAFDAVYTRSGERDEANTHLHITNDYAADVAGRHPKLLFGASIHPYRPDAVAELERCAARGAVLLKWLPITQGIDPSDPRCFPFYDALAAMKIPLLSHTGGETMLPNVNKLADPTLLLPALRRGVTVIAAHCGTRSTFTEPDYLHQFVRLAKDHEHFYGDTAALSLPTRWHAYRKVLNDDAVRQKLVHGSDWPVICFPHWRLGLTTMARMMEEPNWMRRDVLIKQELGFDEAYWQRAGKILRLPSST